jgi:hypothetical protein
MTSICFFSAGKHLPSGASFDSLNIYFGNVSGLSAEGGATEGARNGISSIKRSISRG